MAEIPEHLRNWPGLYVRQGDQIVAAPEKDAEVARKYPQWPDKGHAFQGRRITIMTGKFIYEPNEEVRVIHVAEVVESGTEAFIMGPKPVYGEYLDRRLVRDPPPPWPQAFEPLMYDGAVLPGPAVDYNYEITSYKFSAPGKHQILWKIESLESNVLTIEVVAGRSGMAAEPRPKL